MDFIERIDVLAKRIPQIAASLHTEEATKNALIMPFLHTVLGYDIFNPNEVIPEFKADIATKKGEKVDYALVKGGEVQILIECKNTVKSYQLSMQDNYLDISLLQTLV